MSSDDIAKSLQKKACKSCSQEFTSNALVCPHDGTLLTPVLPDKLIGTVLGERYKILALAGKGGMGLVYKATHLLMDRVVAIKLLHAHLVSDTHALQRFQQEAKASCALTHPNIINVFDFGIAPEGQPYLVMEYLKGISLTEALERQGHMSPARTVHIFVQACEALSHAHENGVVHRDLKPSNLILTTQGQDKNFLKIVDFGIAKLLPAHGRESMQLTQTGEIFGSPLYMSPEQCMAQKLDSRADIYSMGCVMYEALTGVPPLVGKHSVDTIQKHVNEMPRPLRYANPKITLPDGMEPVIFKAMAKDPGQRYQTMNELREDLLKVSGGAQPAVVAPAVSSETSPEGASKSVEIARPGDSHGSPDSRAPAQSGKQGRNETKRPRGLSAFVKVLLLAVVPLLLVAALAIWCTWLGLWYPPLIDSRYLWHWFSENAEAALKAGKLDEADNWAGLAVKAGDQGESPKLRMTRSLNQLGKIYVIQKRYADAELLFEKALAIRQHANSLNNPDGVEIMTNAAMLYALEGKYSFAEMQYLQLLDNEIHMFGENHTEVARTRFLLGKTYQAQNKSVKALAEYKEAITIIADNAGPKSELITPIVKEYTALLRKLGRTAEAEAVEEELAE